MKHYFIKIFAIGFLILTPFIFIACSDSEGSQNKVKDDTQYAYVQTKEMIAQPFEDFISLIGIAKANQQANLAAEEGGKIKEFKKQKGDYVREGDVIVEINNDVLKAQLDAAKVQYDRTETNYKKQEQIYNQNVSSEIQYLNAKYDRDGAKAQYDLIKSRYDKTFIRAPFSGIVDQKFFEVGEMVPPMTSIVALVNLDIIKLEVGAPENFINQIKIGDEAIVTFNELGREFMQKVSYVGNTISADNRTFPIEIKMNNPGRIIKPQLNAEIKIVKLKSKEVIVVPEETVQKTDLGYVVFVEENGVAKMRNIDIISRRDNQVAIKNGLKSGDKLIMVGYQNLIDGEKVKVVNNG